MYGSITTERLRCKKLITSKGQIMKTSNDTYKRKRSFANSVLNSVWLLKGIKSSIFPSDGLLQFGILFKMLT